MINVHLLNAPMGVLAAPTMTTSFLEREEAEEEKARLGMSLAKDAAMAAVLTQNDGNGSGRRKGATKSADDGAVANKRS
jgi:hypothetical protein